MALIEWQTRVLSRNKDFFDTPSKSNKNNLGASSSASSDSSQSSQSRAGDTGAKCSLLSQLVASLTPERHRIRLTQVITVNTRTLANQIEKLNSQSTPPPPLPTDDERNAAKNTRVEEVLFKFPTKDNLIEEYVRLMHSVADQKKEEEAEVPTEGMSVPDFAGKYRMFFFLNRRFACPFLILLVSNTCMYVCVHTYTLRR